MLRAVLEHLKRAATAYAVLLGALALTLLAYYYVQQRVENEARYRFDETVTAAQEAIDRRIDSYEDAMLGARGLFSASESVEMEEWHGYFEGVNLEDRYEGIQAIGYIRYVSLEEKDAFEDQLPETFRDERLENGPAVQPGGERNEYYPVTLVEPLDEVNENLLGRDRYTELEHQDAMDRARDTGKTASTGKVYIFSEASGNSGASLALVPGIVMYLPIYKEGEPAGTLDERRSSLDGFIVCYLTANKLFQDIFEEPYKPEIDFEVYDGAELTPGNLIYNDDAVLRAGEALERPIGGSVGSVVEGVTQLPVFRTDNSASLNRSAEIEMAGSELWVYFEALPGFQADGQSRLPLFVLLSGLVVSLLLFGTTFMLARSRLRAEEAGRGLSEVNRELEVTNRELEAFSYSVSHDLRAPLRSIDGFSQILLEDYADELDEEGKDYLGRVRAASQRMGRLIDDLLGLSRVTRGTMRRERVSLSALAEEVARELEEANPERRIQFSAQGGLEVWGDPRLLRVALENLIGNAWKFTEKQPEARVEFGHSEKLSYTSRVPVYYVRDNGAGFDMAYAGKLFGAFQRLHDANDFEGTGIGLATVQRVVRRHGGHIWAEGEVGRGATFYFTIRPSPRLDPALPREEAKTG
ncbi:MAG TPA: CHASE domain-containing protein [Rubrobacteraceae bacterium]|nr:CHASE domain-containing protein [Rubrobacteraceae bacterium]